MDPVADATPAPAPPAAKPPRHCLTQVETARLVGWLETNRDTITAEQTYPQIAGTAAAAIGFAVTEHNIRGLWKSMGLPSRRPAPIAPLPFGQDAAIQALCRVVLANLGHCSVSPEDLAVLRQVANKTAPVSLGLFKGDAA